MIQDIEKKYGRIAFKKMQGYSLFKSGYGIDSIDYKKVLKKVDILAHVADYTLLEMKLINYIISQTSEEREFSPLQAGVYYEVDLRQFIHTAFRGKKHGQGIKRCYEFMKDISSKCIALKVEDSSNWENSYIGITNMFQDIKISLCEKYVAVMFSAPFIDEITIKHEKSERYALIPVSAYLDASKVSTIKLLEICAEFASIPRAIRFRDYEIDELKALFSASENSEGKNRYSSSQFVKQKLTLAINEINDKKLISEIIGYTGANSKGVILSYSLKYCPRNKKKIKGVRLWIKSDDSVQSLTIASKPQTDSVQQKEIEDTPSLMDENWIESLKVPKHLDDDIEHQMGLKSNPKPKKIYAKDSTPADKPAPADVPADVPADKPAPADVPAYNPDNAGGIAEALAHLLLNKNTNNV